MVSIFSTHTISASEKEKNGRRAGLTRFPLIVHVNPIIQILHDNLMLKVEPPPSVTYTPALATVEALRACLVAFKMAGAASETSRADTLRLGGGRG
jgi:hypothetical protein